MVTLAIIYGVVGLVWAALVLIAHGSTNSKNARKTQVSIPKVLMQIALWPLMLFVGIMVAIGEWIG